MGIQQTKFHVFTLIDINLKTANVKITIKFLKPVIQDRKHQNRKLGLKKHTKNMDSQDSTLKQPTKCD